MLLPPRRDQHDIFRFFKNAFDGCSSQSLQLQHLLRRHDVRLIPTQRFDGGIVHPSHGRKTRVFHEHGTIPVIDRSPHGGRNAPRGIGARKEARFDAAALEHVMEA